MKEDESQQNRNDQAALIDRRYQRGIAELQGPVIKQPVARPESIKKIHARGVMPEIPCCAPVRNTIPQAMTSTTTVRIAVARFELTPSIPTLAKIVVSAAKQAESNAKTNHILFFLPAFSIKLLFFATNFHS